MIFYGKGELDTRGGCFPYRSPGLEAAHG
jgi:hypothetical protein